MNNFRRLLLGIIFCLSVLGLPMCAIWATEVSNNSTGVTFWGTCMVLFIGLVVGIFMYIFDEYCKSIEEIKMLKEIENNKMKCENKDGKKTKEG